MDSFLKRKRPSYVPDAETVGSDAENFSPASDHEKLEDDSPPKKRGKPITKTRVGIGKAPPKPRGKAPKKPAVVGHCSLSKKEFGDRIKCHKMHVQI